MDLLEFIDSIARITKDFIDLGADQESIDIEIMGETIIGKVEIGKITVSVITAATIPQPLRGSSVYFNSTTGEYIFNRLDGESIIIGMSE